MKLRRWMTEILLDVTTEMMEEVATEVVNRARMKGILQPSLAPTSCVGLLTVGEQSLLWHCLLLCSFDSSLLVLMYFCIRQKTKTITLAALMESKKDVLTSSFKLFFQCGVRLQWLV